MRSTRTLSGALALAAGTALALSACASGSAGTAAGTSAAPGTSPGAAAITVTATDDACELDTTGLAAGTHTFTVTNSGSRVTEFYVYASGDRVMGEIENLVPSLSRELTVELPAGTYEAACKPGMVGNGIRNDLTVTGTAAKLTDDAKLQQASQDYQRYVGSQATALVDKTIELTAAVKAGDVEQAKALYPGTRMYYERIEPVAESFGDLDPAIDARDGDLDPGVEWTGFHRIEQVLWQGGDVAALVSVADKLLSDVKSLQARSATLAVGRLDLANGAKGLLDEIAASKITGRGGPLLAHGPVGLPGQPGRLTGRHRGAAPGARRAGQGAPPADRRPVRRGTGRAGRVPLR